MADWWLDDDQIASSYRCAADRAEQVKILAQLCNTTKEKVLDKLLSLGTIDKNKYDELRRSKPRGKKLAAQKVDVMRSLYEKGYADSAISKITGVDRSTISSWRHREGLTANDPALGVDGCWHKQTYKVMNREVKR
jgi:hypothetical protein